ncbi:MAG: nucleotide-binding protein, partial [Nitrososphaeraceae archaeon]
MVGDPKKVFIVHGHDDGSKNELASFLYRLGLTPIILHEQANEGRTVVEKFESYASDVGYAFILLTPDDVGGKDKAELKPRARQNVILELGYFMGKLGRDRVCGLYK